MCWETDKERGGQTASERELGVDRQAPKSRQERKWLADLKEGQGRKQGLLGSLAKHSGLGRDKSGYLSSQCRFQGHHKSDAYTISRDL